MTRLMTPRDFLFYLCCFCVLPPTLWTAVDKVPDLEVHPYEVNSNHQITTAKQPLLILGDNRFIDPLLVTAYVSLLSQV